MLILSSISQFNLCKSQSKVIKALDLGVASMCRGELARLECRADYAYGESGKRPKIPANATLIYEVSFDYIVFCLINRLKYIEFRSSSSVGRARI
jgi:hypothetical protein